MNNLSPEKQNTVAWELRQNGKSRDYDIFSAGAPASAGKIARVFSRDGRDKIARSHAVLITAAPQLLAALEHIVTAYDDTWLLMDLECSLGSYDTQIQPDFIRQARAAIAAIKEISECQN